MITEPPRCFRCGTAYLIVVKVPTKLISSVERKSSTLRSSIPAHLPLTPALATTTSSRPHLSTVAAIAERTESSSLTSQVTLVAVPPARPIAWATSRSSSGVRPASATLAPRRANNVAAACPMPDPPPLMNATLSCMSHLTSLSWLEVTSRADRDYAPQCAIQCCRVRPLPSPVQAISSSPIDATLPESRSTSEIPMRPSLTAHERGHTPIRPLASNRHPLRSCSDTPAAHAQRQHPAGCSARRAGGDK